MKLFLLSLFIMSTRLTVAQFNGLILDDETYERTPMVEKPAERTKLPASIDLRAYCPEPGDQGSIPSCVAWALANALSIQNALSNNRTDAREIEKMKFSVGYIYNQIKNNGDCLGGASFNAGLDLLVTNGDCLADQLPYSIDCLPFPQEFHHQQAFSNRIPGYRKVFSSSATIDEKIDKILDELAQFRPVLIALNVPNDFRKYPSGVKPGITWSGSDPHALVIVGYDDNTDLFIIMNSYGSDWGEQGFFRMDYETLGAHVRYGFILLRK